MKGFDAVHVVSSHYGPELWLGEVKFYESITAAIRDVLTELKKHLEFQFLRDEFMWVSNKMGKPTGNEAEIRRLLDESTSLDEVFQALHIPVLLTYKSTTVNQHSADNAAYRKAISKELSQHFETFRAKGLPKNVSIHLFLVPLAGKARLLAAFDRRLKDLQRL